MGTAQNPQLLRSPLPTTSCFQTQLFIGLTRLSAVTLSVWRVGQAGVLGLQKHGKWLMCALDA
jgi:hypothetical protein